MHLQDRALGVLALLAARQELQSGSIIFIGHSLGGLLIKQILRTADTQAPNNPNIDDFVRRVRRVVFLSTPHQGSDLTGWIKWIGVLSPASVTLARNDPALRELNCWYRSYATQHRIENLTLLEARRSYGIAFVVKPDSGDPGLPSSDAVFLVDEDHFSISKPRNRDVDVYRHIQQFIAKSIESVHRDTLIHEKLDTLKEMVESGFQGQVGIAKFEPGGE